MAFNLDALVAEELKGNPSADPHVVAFAIAKRIPKTKLYEVVEHLLQWEVRAKVRSARHFNGGLTTSGKWNGVAEQTNSPTWRIWTESGWKFFPMMTVEDCEFAAQDYEKRAATNEARAKYFWRLAELLRSAGVETIADLPPDEVEAA